MHRPVRPKVRRVGCSCFGFGLGLCDFVAAFDAAFDAVDFLMVLAGACLALADLLADLLALAIGSVFRYSAGSSL